MEPSSSSRRPLRHLYQPWTLVLAFYRAKIITVEPAVILFTLSMGIYIPLYEQYYYHYYGSKLLKNTSFIFPNTSFCLSTDMITNYTGNNESYKLDQSFSNNLLAYGQIANKVPAIVVTLMFGSLTDRFGRKVGVCLPAVGYSLQCIFAIFIIKYNLNPYYFILANFISGIFGDFTGIIASCFSYVADISSLKWRSLRIGVIEGSIAFAGSAGDFLGGYWLNQIHCNYIPPLIFCVACNLSIIAYMVLLVPESLTRSEREKIVNKNPKGIKKYAQGFKLLCGGLPPVSTWKVYVAMLMDILIVLNVWGNNLLSVYFLKTPPFSFNPQQIGLYQAIRSISQGLASIFIVGLLAALKVNDAWTMLIAALISGGCSMLIGFSSKAWQVYTIEAFQGIEGIGWTGARGLMSKLVEPETQGSLFALVASVESAAGLLAGACWPLIYPVTLKHHMRSGTVYIFMAALAFMVVPLVISILMFNYCKKYRNPVVIQAGCKNIQERLSNADDDNEDKPLLTNIVNNN